MFTKENAVLHRVVKKIKNNAIKKKEGREMETKKRSLSLILAIAMLLATACGAWALTPNADGVYEIGSEQDLKDFRDGINDGTIDADSDAILTADIALTSNWKPIGTHVITGSSGSYVLDKDYSYNGTFDGNGKTITGLTAVSADAADIYLSKTVTVGALGLFGATSSDVVLKDVAIQGADLSGLGGSYFDGRFYRAGTVACHNYGQIENIHVTDAVVKGGSSGGIVDGNGGVITGCTVYNIVLAGDGGGIASGNGGEIINCTVTKMTKPDSEGTNAGGISGVNEGSIRNCVVSDIEDVSGYGMSDAIFGGIVGYQDYQATAEIVNCTASNISNIDGYHYMGGIVGYVGWGTVVNCTASEIKDIAPVNVEDMEGVFLGGIAGANDGTVTNCTASGINNITAGFVGGIVGQNNSIGTVTGCTASESEILLEGLGVGGGIAGDSNGKITSCVASDISVKGWTAGGVAGNHGFGWNGREAVIENSVAIDCTVSAEYHAGGVVGMSVAIVRDSAAVNTTAKSVAINEDSEEGEGFAGGLLGTLGETYPSADISNCAYPLGIVDVTDMIFSYPDEWAIGNLSPDAVAASYDNILSYDPDDLEEDIPGIVAILKQGVTVTVEKGKTFDLDVTTLPGTLGIEDLTCTWSTEGKSIVTVTPNTGLVVTLSGVALGTETVTCEVRGDINVDLVCVVTVVDEVVPEITAISPKDGIIYQGDVVDFLYSFLPHTAIAVNSDGLAGSGLLADILNGQVTLTGTADGEGNYHYVVTLRTADGHVFTQKIPVTVQQGSRRHGGGGGSSNCNSGVGAAVFALLGLAYVYKKK